MRSLLHRVTDEPSVIEGARVLTGRALEALVDDKARALAAQGAAPGQRVACAMVNSLDHVVAFLAAWKLGATWVPINPAYGVVERGHIVQDCAPALVLTDGGVSMHGASAQRSDDTALLIYTSGTTGKSKGCALTHSGVLDATLSLARAWRMSEQDELVHALPLFHVHGLCVALGGALLTGARVRLVDKFTPSAVVAGVRAGGTVFMGVPTMYRRLLDHLEGAPADAAHLAKARLFCSGSAPLPAADFAAWRERTGHEIVERYGMSETLITLSNPLDGARRAGTVGRPLPGVSVRIVDDELQVKGPGVMRGYWNDPANTARTFTSDGWLRTGDAASTDPDGYVTILGRLASDFVKVGGYKVSTREVEDALRSHPAVADVAVVGVPDREWGERVVACVVATGAAPSLTELQEHARAALAAHKLPRELLVVDELPKNAMGKVQKKLLVAKAEP